MDKETFSSYGWLVVTVVVIALMIAFAPTFAQLIKDSVDELLTSFDTEADGIMTELGTELEGIVAGE